MGLGRQQFIGFFLGRQPGLIGSFDWGLWAGLGVHQQRLTCASRPFDLFVAYVWSKGLIFFLALWARRASEKWVLLHSDFGRDARSHGRSLVCLHHFTLLNP